MVDQLRGVSSPDDLQTKADAADLLGVDIDANDAEVEDAFRDLVPKAHPDQGGSPELFKAVDEARDMMKRLSGRSASSSSSSSSGGPSPPGGAGGAGPRGSTTPGAGARPDEDLVDSIEDMLRQRMTEREMKDRYFEDTEYRDIAEILASLVMSGSIDLGSLERMVSGDDRFSSNIGSATGGNYSRRGGGSNFGNSGYASSDPSDYMGYGSPDSGDDGTDSDDDDSDSGGVDFGGL